MPEAATHPSASHGVGFFGKLAGAGDFVQRRLPAAFVDRWDHHFEQAVAGSREQIGERWHTAWHASPAWRFVLAPGVCSESAWAGIVAPAADRVGRCFPMVIAAPLADGGEASLQALRDGERWFDALEATHAQAQREGFGAEAFDAALTALPSLADMRSADPLAALHAVDWRSADYWRLPLQTQATPFLCALWSSLSAAGGRPCLWWTRGAGAVPASVLATQGLPDARAYAAFLDAAQADARWRTPPGLYVAGGQPPAMAPPPAVAAMHAHASGEPAWASAAVAGPSGADATVPGLARTLLPDDLSALLEGLAPPLPPPPSTDSGDVTVPGFARGVALDIAAAAAPVAMPPTRPPSPAAMPPPAPPGTPDTPAVATVEAVFRGSGGALTLVAADDGAHDPRCKAAAIARSVAAALQPGDFARGMRPLCERLLAYHPALQASGQDLIDPVMEDAAVVALHTTGRWAAALRVGAGEAWHWRRGMLRAVFSDEAQDAGAAVEFDDLLFRRAPPIGVGLGGEGTPRCDETVCDVAPGDRLLLLAGRRLVGLPQELLTSALALPSCDGARAHIAAAAALGPDPAPWPLAIIEITA